MNVSTRPVWPARFIVEGVSLAEYHYEFGRDLDVDFREEETPHTVHVAQVVSSVLSFYGVECPDDDARMLAWLDHRGAGLDSAAVWGVAMVDESRAALVTPRGCLESAGEYLALVSSPESDRYRAFYAVPGVRYTPAMMVSPPWLRKVVTDE